MRLNFMVCDLYAIFLLLVLSLYSCKGQVENNISSDLKAGVGLSKSSRDAIGGTSNSVIYKDQISQVVRKIFQDSRGIIWFGTQNGAFKLVNNKLISIKDIRSEANSPVTIKDICEDDNGVIWFGHTDGVSSIYEDKVKNYYESDGLISNDVWSIESDQKGRIWIGTLRGVSILEGDMFTFFELPKGKIDTTLGISSREIVHDIMLDHEGVLWFCTNAGLFSYTDEKLINVSEEFDIKTNFINSIIEVNEQGEYWISTKEDLYHLKDDQVDNLTKDKVETGKGIGSIEIDKAGVVWFVSDQHILYKYQNKMLTKFPKSEDNKGPVIFQIFEDKESRLWFVGYGGAFRLEAGQFVNITKAGPW